MKNRTLLIGILMLVFIVLMAALATHAATVVITAPAESTIRKTVRPGNDRNKTILVTVNPGDTVTIERTYSWTKIANEGQQFLLAITPQVVRYGTEKGWVEKAIIGGGVCSNATFGSDPVGGISKRCEVRSGPPVVIPPPPPVIDHSGHGPVVDKATIPARASGDFLSERIRTTWHNPLDGDKPAPECKVASRTCAQAPPYVVGPRGDSGAFRIWCDTSHYANDDPIVYPGKPGFAHLHTFFGNTSTDANSTVSSLSVGGSTCTGGKINQSTYWMPAVVDKVTGKVVPIRGSNFYYKTSAELGISAVYTAMPDGLRFIVGDAKNKDPNAVTGRYLCYGPAGENPGWKRSISAAVADGTCVPGGEMVIEVGFPICWDGKNLDSPSHNTHIVGVQQLQQMPFTKFCPTTHPVILPSYSFNANIPIVAGMSPANWRLSSDAYDSTLPGGLSLHADVIWKWNRPVIETFVRECVNGRRNGNNHLLCDGRTLY